MIKDTWVIHETERYDKLEIRWTLRHPEPVIGVLVKIIDDLPGVERVYSHRYSIEVFFAPHITTKEQCAGRVKEGIAAWMQSSHYWKDTEII